MVEEKINKEVDTWTSFGSKISFKEAIKTESMATIFFLLKTTEKTGNKSTKETFNL